MQLAQTLQDLYLLVKQAYKTGKVAKVVTKLPVGTDVRSVSIRASMGNVKHDKDLQAIVDAGKVGPNSIGFCWYRGPTGVVTWLAKFEIIPNSISIVFLPVEYQGLEGDPQLPCELL